MATVLKSFEKWKDFLHERLEQAEKAGMSEETIAKMAFQIGEFLSDKVDPENKEERLLQELWRVGDEQERRALAKLMVRLVGEA
ncbi:DUF3243 domain-containing protein [Paenibacillus sp. y28]|uniref:DUF3243 domain-containing protein n=1 Tax=Paenibacillus sp. y28 TaxID=3129110 RepID=UPI00301B0ACD